MKNFTLLIVLFGWFSGVSAHAADQARKPSREETFKALSKEIGPGTSLELKALEIRTKIYEPQVIYVLDRTKIEIDFKEEEMHFLQRISDPISENDF